MGTNSAKNMELIEHYAQNFAKNLDEGDMFTPLIEHLCPLNFLCSKSLATSGPEGKIIGMGPSLKHIKEDMRVSDIITCGPKMMERIALRLKSEEEVQVV